MEKRVALLLSGLPRQWRTCLPTQLSLFRDVPVDVFFHFWDVIDESEKKELLDFLKPKAYAFEAPKDFSSYDTDPAFTHDRINIPSRMASQYYSWRQVAALFAPQREAYCWAMRSRSDLQFVATLEDALPYLDKNKILLYWWDEARLVSDIFALGDAQVVYQYHLLFDKLHDYAAEGVLLNPEAMLTHHLEKMPELSAFMQTSPVYFVRRPHMENYSIEACLRENPGRNKWLDPEVVASHKTFFHKKDGSEGETYVECFKNGQLTRLSEELTPRTR